jgi:hypothetical protein
MYCEPIIKTHLIKISDTHGKILLEYPTDTLLDQITDEMSIIMMYYSTRKFIISNHDKILSNYRMITHEETKTESFKNLFINSYIFDNGIYILDESNNVRKHGFPTIQNDKCVMYYGPYPVKLSLYEKRTLAKIVVNPSKLLGDELKKCIFLDENEIFTCDAFYTLGLFIAKNISFDNNTIQW